MSGIKEKKKRDLATPILIAVFFAGMCIMLYPVVSDMWNSRVQSRVIMNYNAVVESISPEEYAAEIEKANAYNAALARLPFPILDHEGVEGYEDALNITGTGVMGYIEIPRINLKLPICHGTSDEVLNVAVGHMEGSSLPVGGEGTHCVLSAHRGLPGAKLFSGLDKLEEDDIFTITVLNELLTYRVDQIRIVEPDEFQDLLPQEGQDYCTLLTCTPYGINTHRLLVRGHRIPNLSENDIVIANEAYELDSTMLAPFAAAPVLLILLIIMLVRTRKKKSKRNDE